MDQLSYVGPMSEDEYLATVERIQQAMAIEPFHPSVVDVVKLLSDWRDLSNQNERLWAVVDALEALRESAALSGEAPWLPWPALDIALAALAKRDGPRRIAAHNRLVDEGRQHT